MYVSTFSTRLILSKFFAGWFVWGGAEISSYFAKRPAAAHTRVSTK
jgi:hypothetical protein